jgi:hypothetical protein
MNISLYNNPMSSKTVTNNISSNKNTMSSSDIRKASFDEFCKISNELYTKGNITPIEEALMTFNPELSPQQVGKGNVFLTKSDQYGKRDWIAEFEARANQNLKYSNLESYKIDTSIVNKLKQYELTQYI